MWWSFLLGYLMFGYLTCLSWLLESFLGVLLLTNWCGFFWDVGYLLNLTVCHESHSFVLSWMTNLIYFLTKSIGSSCYHESRISMVSSCMALRAIGFWFYFLYSHCMVIYVLIHGVEFSLRIQCILPYNGVFYHKWLGPS